MQLRSILQQADSLLVSHPSTLALVLFRPLILLLFHRGFEEVIRSFRCGLGELLWLPQLGDDAQAGVDFAHSARFFPGLAAGGLFGGGLVGLPAAFGQDPAAAAGRLDQQDLFAVVGEGHDAGYESFALSAVAWLIC